MASRNMIKLLLKLYLNDGKEINNSNPTQKVLTHLNLIYVNSNRLYLTNLGNHYLSSNITYKGKLRRLFYDLVNWKCWQIASVIMIIICGVLSTFCFSISSIFVVMWLVGLITLVITLCIANIHYHSAKLRALNLEQKFTIPRFLSFIKKYYPKKYQQEKNIILSNL